MPSCRAVSMAAARCSSSCCCQRWSSRPGSAVACSICRPGVTAPCRCPCSPALDCSRSGARCASCPHAWRRSNGRPLAGPYWPMQAIPGGGKWPMRRPVEIELKFQVPAEQAARLAAEMARGSAPGGSARRTLVAAYMDSADRRLASAGIAWRLRREGRRWVQALKKGGANPLERFEHEVIRPGPTPDASMHAGTAVGDELLAILEQARADGNEVGVRFRTEVRRTLRRIRTRGAIVELAFDEGRIVAGEHTARIRELEFELVSGDVGAMIGLAARWCGRFGLAYDPRSKAERGDALVDGRPLAPVRKARRPAYPVDATPTEALGAVLDECLAHIGYNVVGLLEGEADNRIDHVHQARVGIRRLRSALRCFADWTPAPSQALVDGLRTLFATLG